MKLDRAEVVWMYHQAVNRCVENGQSLAWLFETYYAEEIVERCAQIAQDCSDMRIPLSEVPDLIRKFESPLESLNDEI